MRSGLGAPTFRYGKETTERGEGWASPPVFNRTVALKDTWAKVEKKQTPRG